ncbi:TPA: polymorphic toxin MafB class 1, partial [Neisseria meningitidis]
YHVNGTARSIKLNPTDTRSIRQRISDNYNNLGSNFSDRADEANRKMFEHNAKLDRWGNSMEFINGVAAGALNPFISAGEALGIGDILYGTRYAIDKAAMRNIAPLPAEGKFAVIGGLGSVAGFEKNTREAVDRWIQENPNAAETVEAVFNVAAAAKVAKLAKAAKPGKAAVSGDFADSYKKKLALSDSARQLYQNAKYREALDIHYEDLIRRKTDGSSKFINGREIDAVTNDALIQAKRTISAIDKPKNFLNQKNRKQIKATIEAANQQGKRAEFWFKYGVHSQVKSYIESKGGIVKTGLGD